MDLSYSLARKPTTINMDMNLLERAIADTLVVPPFGPELKFEPELLRTGLRSSPRFEG
jgi:hypothetical protein